MSRFTRVFIGVVVFVVLAKASYMTISERESRDAWFQVQEWARTNTPINALFLTPTSPGGFRVRSERSVVCEWRDQGHVMPGGNKVFMDSLNAGCVVAIVVRQQDAQRFRVSGKSRCHPAEFGKHDDHYNE